MGFLWGVPRKLIKRITEIEIDSHYYDNDAVPTPQTSFTYNVNKSNKTAEITGFVSNNISQAVMPYRIQYGETASHMFANVKSIKSGSFKNNQYLTDMTIPNTIDIIPSNCFSDCSNLIRINIPKSVKIIESNAFSGCTNLKSLLIPFNVITIGEDVFTNCPNLKIICYKHSEAETYAKAHNIKYSLISYTLDDDITENSENLVTGGIIYKWKKFLDDKINANTNRINAHINNKSNPHDSSQFKDANLYGTSIFNISKEDIKNSANTKLLVNKEYVDDKAIETVDPSTGSGYQTIVDNKLKTNSKIIPIAINEVNDKVNSIVTDLVAGWNEVSTNKLYDFGWTFLNSPYCHKDGVPVDFKIKNYDNNIKNNKHCFEIYVPTDCQLQCSVTPSSVISGQKMDYMIINYYYTGADGTDLDTVTELSSANISGTVGYGQGNSITKNNKTLLSWAGDQRGGGTNNSSVKYYESIYLDLNAITEECGEDCEIVLYATWFTSRVNGYINASFNCYTGTDVNFTANDNKWNISGADVIETYTNPVEMRCYIATRRGSPNYKQNYTPAFKLSIHSNTQNNVRTISIEALS